MTDHPETREAKEVSGPPRLHIDAAMRVNFASAQNDIPIMRAIAMENPR